MDAKSALGEIRGAENKIKNIVEEAKAEAHRIVHEALIAKEGIIQAARGRAKADAQKLKEKIQQEITREVAAIEGKSAEEIKRLRARAAENLPRAADFLKDKLELSPFAEGHGS